jgi:hypothetical protein
MMFPGIKEIAVSKKWHSTKSSVAGNENGYLFNLSDGSGFKFILFSGLNIPEPSVNAINQEFEKFNLIPGPCAHP